MSNVIKFPYSACRRVHSRKPRISKNGAPEERAAKAEAVRPDPSTAPNVVQLSGKPVRPHTPPSPEEMAQFSALLAQPWVSAMMRAIMEKT
jgi:hypothetical protein